MGIIQSRQPTLPPMKGQTILHSWHTQDLNTGSMEGGDPTNHTIESLEIKKCS